VAVTIVNAFRNTITNYDSVRIPPVLIQVPSPDIVSLVVSPRRPACAEGLQQLWQKFVAAAFLVCLRKIYLEVLNQQIF